QPLTIDLDYEFQADIDVFAEAMVAVRPQRGEPLPIPSSRDVRLRLAPCCANNPNYYAEDAVRFGLVSSIETRSDEPAEGTLIFGSPAPEQELNAIYWRNAPDMAKRLAEQLAFDVSGLTFTGMAGQRVVFGAS